LSGAGHPERLLWYACGRLDAAEVEAVERHLAVCEACRAELPRLRSIGASLRREAGAGHVEAPALVSFHDGEAAPPAAAKIAAHLETCAACRADLASLGRASAPGRRRWEGVVALPPPAVGNAAASWSRRVRRLSAAAAIVFMIVTWPARPLVSTAAFAPVLRGSEPARRLAGLGPWRLSVLLPTQASETDYAIRIRGVDGGETAVYPVSGRFGPAGPVIVEVSSFAKPGRYVLELQATGEGDAGPHAYPFEVVGAR